MINSPQHLLSSLDVPLGLSVLFATMQDFGLVLLDQQGHVLASNPLAQEYYGLTQAHAGLQLSKHYADFQALLEQSGKGQIVSRQHWLTLADRDRILLQESLVRIDMDTFKGFVLRSQALISKEEQRIDTEEAPPLPILHNFHGAFHQAPIGMMLVNMDWHVMHVNRSICDMLGYSAEELLSKTFQEITHPDDIKTDLDLVRQMIAGDINDYRLEKRYFHKDGHVIWMLLSASLLKDENRIPQYFIFHIQDISEYKRIQKQISEYAYQDALTNLPNRRLLQDRLRLAVSHANRYKRRLGLMFLDIDRFKSINDTYGHAFGDELIKSVASRLSESVRSADTVCRLGGDEFVIVVSEIKQNEDISVVAEKILGNIRKPLQIEDHEIQVTVSIGVTMFDAQSGDDAESMMRKADQALYEMKRAGRNGYRVYRPAPHNL